MTLPDPPPFPLLPGSTRERLLWLDWANRHARNAVEQDRLLRLQETANETKEKE